MKIVKLFHIHLDDKRIFGLDVLRFIAIFVVIWGHASDLLPPPYNKIHENLFPIDGVTIFFVLSGFLIGRILLKILEDSPASFNVLLDFWNRRWLRTLPAYYFVLGIICLIHLRYDSQFKLTDAKWFVIFLQNFWSHDVFIFGESWSLSIEEWFYLSIPAAIFGIASLKLFKTKHVVLIVAFSVIVLVTFFPFYKYDLMPPGTIAQWDVEFRRLVVTRLDSLMYGVIGAYLYRYHYNLWNSMKPLIYIGIVMIVWLVYSGIVVTGLFGSVFYFSVFSIGILLCLPKLSEQTYAKGTFQKGITYVSVISYSLYLLNYTVIREFLVEDVLKNKVLDRLSLSVNTEVAIKYLAYWVLLFTLSTLMYNLVELPGMKLREKFKMKKLSPAKDG